MKRHELTDEPWELIDPIVPKRTATTGRKPRNPRLSYCTLKVTSSP